jgi:hypothetical protein
MSKTKTEVKDRAARMIGFLDIGDTLAGDQDTRMDEAWDAVHAWLKNKGLDAFPTAGPVPDEMVPHIKALIAFDAMDDFHAPPSKKQDITVKQTIAQRDLPGLVLADHESLEEPVDY